MKSLLLICCATLGFAATEPILSLASLKAVEASIDDGVRSHINDPYDLLGPARGTYLAGYGAVFTVHIDLVLTSPLNLSPFKPAPTEKDLNELHDRKARKVVAFRETMRGLMTNGVRLLPALPPDERIVMEAFLFNHNWEQSRGLPHRIVLTARKGQLLDAVNRHATPGELANLIVEEEL
jgi:hypothetical protein